MKKLKQYDIEDESCHRYEDIRIYNLYKLQGNFRGDLEESNEWVQEDSVLLAGQAAEDSCPEGTHG